MANFHEDWGGQAAYVLTLAQALRDAGHRLWVICPADSQLSRRAGQAGIPTFTSCRLRRGLRPFEFWREVRAFAAFLREVEADVVHTHGPPECWRAALACRMFRLRCRHVRTKHNSYRVAAHPANLWLYRRGIDRLVVVAGALKPLLAGLLPPERIDVLHAPVADRFLATADGGPFRAELGISPETPLIGAVGRLAADKGQADILKALKLIRTQHPETMAVFVGEGRELRRLETLATELGVTNRVRFLGARQDVPAITAALDVSVLASTGCDASSTVVKEALAAGVPMVATEVGGIREIIEDGATGRIVPPGDPARLAEAISATLSDRARARSMAAAGREAMKERFSETAAATAQAAIYRRVLQGSTP